MKTKVNTTILIKHSQRKKLMEIFECTYPTIRTALRGNATTKLHFKIRKAALENGGVEMKSI